MHIAIPHSQVEQRASLMSKFEGKSGICVVSSWGVPLLPERLEGALRRLSRVEIGKDLASFTSSKRRRQFVLRLLPHFTLL